MRSLLLMRTALPCLKSNYTHLTYLRLKTMTLRDDAKAALELQRQEKQAEITALQAQLEEELEDMPFS